MRLIECGDHKYSPAVIVCVHLFDGTSHEWCRIEGEGEEMDDWLCPECAERMDELNVDDLRTVCMHCARELREGTEDAS
jgi:hypothetical protein